jgi:hypothetical protein
MAPNKAGNHFEVLCYSKAEVDRAAAFVGVEPRWDELVTREVPGASEPLFDISSTIDTFCRRMAEAGESLRASQAFRSAHSRSMSSLDSAAWKDGDDGTRHELHRAELGATEAVRLAQVLMRRPCVHYTLSFPEYLDFLHFELMVRDHASDDIGFVIGVFRDLDLTEKYPVHLAKALAERLHPVLQRLHMPIQRVLCYTDALELIMLDLQSLGADRQLGQGFDG